MVTVNTNQAELESYNGLIDFECNKITNKISLTGAADAAASGRRTTTIREIEIYCDCKGKCADKRCKCFCANQKCNSHCHGKNSVNSKCCTNIEALSLIISFL